MADQHLKDKGWLSALLGDSRKNTVGCVRLWEEVTHSDHSLSVTRTDFCSQRVQVAVLMSIPLRGSESIYTNNLQSQRVKNAGGTGKPRV